LTLKNERIRQFVQRNWLLIIIWSCALVLRIIIAYISKGLVHPDEQFQSIEIAFERITGYGYIAWEFKDGARSWLYPSIVLLIFKTMIFLGITRIETILFAVRLFSALCSMVTVITSYFFGRLLFNKKVGLIATFFVSFWFDFLFWSARTITDSLAMNFTFLGSYFIFRLLKKPRLIKSLPSKERTKRLKFEALYGSLAGFVFGLAFMFKFPTLILLIPLAIILLINRNWRGTIFLSILLLVMILGQGLLDLFTWGSFLHSPIVFFQYNIISGGNAAHGVSPFLAYIPQMIDANGEFFLLLLLFFFIGLSNERKAMYLLITIMVYFLVFNCIAHKEYRFMLPIIAPIVLFAARGFLKYPQVIHKTNLRKGLYGFFALLMIGFSIANSCYFYSFQPRKQICDAFHFVGTQKDSEVLLVSLPGEFFGPGYTYLEKNIPVKYFRASTLTFFLIYYQTNTTYIILPEQDYLTNIETYQSIIAYQNLTLVKFFAGTHPRFDESIYVLRN